nr:efflux RND transporter permease subunit [uncultured Desulfuromonas sp.]
MNALNGKETNKGIIAWFAHNSVAANLLLFLIIVLGVVQSTSLRKEAFPSMEPDSLSVSIVYNSGSAKQSEEGLAMKIEDELEDVIGIKTITSTSTGNGVSVTVEKKTGYDLNILLRDVKAKVDGISNFPADAENPVIEKDERQEHALWIQLYGDVDRYTLQKLADDLKTDLLSDVDVSEVTISGWLDPMMMIEIDEGRLQAYGLSLSDVEDAINQGSSSTMTAVLNEQQMYLQLKASQQAYLKEEFANIPLLTGNDGRQLLLGEVATILDSYDDRTAVLSRYNGHTSLAVEVITTGQDDITDTVEGARKVVAQWRSEGKLPTTVQMDTWYDRSENIRDRLNLLVRNALSGIAVVFALLAVFLNLSVAFWVAMGLPFIFFGTLFFMGDSFAGLSLNEFTTFGFIMALGIVVDDAVVIGESVYTTRRRDGDTLNNTILGTMKVAVPTMFGVFTTVAAFYALSMTSGKLGELYAQFAVVVTICLILSLIESKLILPSHLAHLNTHRAPSHNPVARGWYHVQHGADQLLNGFSQRIYKPLIEWALNNRYAVTIVFMALFALVVAMPFTGAVRMGFFPDIPGDTVRAELTMRNDASYGQTHSNLTRLEQLAYATDRELSGVTDSSHISSLQLLSESDQAGKITVELADDAPYDINTFTHVWQDKAGMPEGALTLSIQNTPRMVDAVRIELRANDDAILSGAGEEIKAYLQAVPGVSGLEDNLEPGQPQLLLSLNQQGYALGLTTDMLASQVLQAFDGQVVQRYQRNTDEIEVRVRYPAGDRQTPTDVLKTRIRTTDGTVLPLSSVATTSYGYTRDSITRIDGKRAVYLSADVDKDVISSTALVSQLKTKLVPELTRNYPGLSLHFAGEAEEQAETQTSMAQMFLLALLLIYILLAVPLKSYIQPLLIMTAIPFGILGAILGHWLNDLTLGILSLNGIIALSGVVVNDSLLLVSTFNELRSDTEHLHEAISEACRSRLRAVLLTSLTTFGGLVPLISETSRQAQFLIPAAVSLAYGIMFATVITLILIPTLLMIHHDVVTLLARVKQFFFPSNEPSHAECITD